MLQNHTANACPANAFAVASSPLCTREKLQQKLAKTPHQNPVHNQEMRVHNVIAGEL